MQEDLKDKDLEGCTFKPQIYSVEEGYQKRNLDQFLADQQRFMERVSKKKEDVKNQVVEVEVSTMHPQIDETSKRIVEEKLAEKRNKPTHERLYELNKELQTKKLQKLEAERNKFRVEQSQNKSVSHREKPLDQTLYEDAERRRKELAQKKEELDRTRDKPKDKKYYNEKSDKYVIQRLDKELIQA